MARSGRGRGRSALTFNIDALGLGKGEALPEAVFGPPPLYPNNDTLALEDLFKRNVKGLAILLTTQKADFKPTPLKTGEDEDYLLALKQELRNAMRSTPYFVTKRDDDQGSVPVERYSKKYLQMNEKALEWTPDWRRFPRELKPKAKTGKGGKLKMTKTTAAPKTHVDVLKKIEELEEKGDGEKSEEEEKDKDKEDDGKEEESEEYDEEEHEEENDYIASYFEDGDDYGAGSDDNADEATY